MKINKRTPGASGLRAFFDDQIRHLQQLVDGLSSRRGDDEAQTAKDRQIVDHFVDKVNSKMRSVHGFDGKLRGRVRALYNHVLQVAGEIPPPIELSQDAFATDPLVNALFVNAHDVDRLFLNDREIAAYFNARENYNAPVFYALLTACKSEKSKLGISMLGDTLIRDVTQTAVNFSSHKLQLPCTSIEELSTALRQYLFDRVILLIKQKMASKMNDQASQINGKSYESKVKSLANPNVYLRALLEKMKNPGDLLSIENGHFKLSKLGIKLNDDDTQCANEFDIPHLIWSDGTRNVLLQIAYTRQTKKATTNDDSLQMKRN